MCRVVYAGFCDCIDYTLVRRYTVLISYGPGLRRRFSTGAQVCHIRRRFSNCRVFLYFADAPACKCILFSKADANAALDVIKATPGCEEILVPPPAVETEPLSSEEQCFMSSRAFTYSAQGKAPPEFEELENQASLGSSRMTAQEEAKLHAFLRANGGFALKQTQELGNCLYSAVLRGIDIKESSQPCI